MSFSSKAVCDIVFRFDLAANMRESKREVQYNLRSGVDTSLKPRETMLHVQQRDSRPELLLTSSDVDDDVLFVKDDYEMYSEQVAKLCQEILDREYVGNWLRTEVNRISNLLEQWRQQREELLVSAERSQQLWGCQLRLKKAALNHIKSVQKELMLAQTECAELNRDNWPRLTFEQVMLLLLLLPSRNAAMSKQVLMICKEEKGL